VVGEVREVGTGHAAGRVHRRRAVSPTAAGTVLKICRTVAVEPAHETVEVAGRPRRVGMPYYVIAPPAQERTRLFAPLAGVPGGRTATPFKGSPVTANRSQSSPFASPRVSRLNLSVLNPPFRQHRTSASQSARLPSPAASSLDGVAASESLVKSRKCTCKACEASLRTRESRHACWLIICSLFGATCR